MRNSLTIPRVAAGLVLGLLLVGCGTKQAEQKTASTAEPQPAQQAAQTQPAEQTTKAYPLNWCIVSGEKLGEMGPPVEYKYQDREIKFCCKNCVKTFEKDPAKYIAKLDSAAAGLIKAPAEEEKGTGG